MHQDSYYPASTQTSHMVGSSSELQHQQWSLMDQQKQYREFLETSQNEVLQCVQKEIEQAETLQAQIKAKWRMTSQIMGMNERQYGNNIICRQVQQQKQILGQVGNNSGQNEQAFSRQFGENNRGVKQQMFQSNNYGMISNELSIPSAQMRIKQAGLQYQNSRNISFEEKYSGNQMGNQVQQIENNNDSRREQFFPQFSSQMGSNYNDFRDKQINFLEVPQVQLNYEPSLSTNSKNDYFQQNQTNKGNNNNMTNQKQLRFYPKIVEEDNQIIPSYQMYNQQRSIDNEVNTIKKQLISKQQSTEQHPLNKVIIPKQQLSLSQLAPKLSCEHHPIKITSTNHSNFQETHNYPVKNKNIFISLETEMNTTSLSQQFKLASSFVKDLLAILPNQDESFSQSQNINQELSQKELISQIKNTSIESTQLIDSIQPYCIEGTSKLNKNHNKIIKKQPNQKKINNNECQMNLSKSISKKKAKLIVANHALKIMPQQKSQQQDLSHNYYDFLERFHLKY